MPALPAFAAEKLKTLAAEARLRTLYTSERSDGVYVLRGGRRLVSFSCNDYLGLSAHPKVIEAAKAALDKYGMGAGASRLITGNHPYYDELEALLAEMKGAEAACVFGSGYLTNLGVIPALVGKGDLILADKLIHACMIDGAKLSGATLKRFSHNSLDSLNKLLINNDYKKPLILAETVFSMDGDRAPVEDITMIARRYDNTVVMTDDAHGFGLFPPQQEVDIQMGTLSKAIGCYGGYVCASREVIDYIKTSARSLIYSTALPPSVVAGAIAAIRLMNDELSRRPLDYARMFTDLLGLPEAQSAIVPVIIGDEKNTMEASRQLEEEGFLVQAIRPPTVPEGTSRLRFTFSASHKKEHIESLAACIKKMRLV